VSDIPVKHWSRPDGCRRKLLPPLVFTERNRSIVLQLVSAMSSPECKFCGHDNPASAKYCNECAAPLHLKPCNECEAVNDRAATRCYKCGADLQERALVEETLETGRQQSSVDLPASRTTRFSQQPQRSHSQDAHAVDTRLSHVRREGVRVVTDLVELFAHERPFSVAPWFSAPKALAQRNDVRVREATDQRHFVIRVALSTILVASLTTAGYLTYRYSADVGSNAKKDSRSSADASRTPAAAGVASASKTLGASTATMAAKMPIAGPGDTAASSITEGRIRTLTPENNTKDSPDSKAEVSFAFEIA